MRLTGPYCAVAYSVQFLEETMLTGLLRSLSLAEAFLNKGRYCGCSHAAVYWPENRISAIMLDENARCIVTASTKLKKWTRVTKESVTVQPMCAALYNSTFRQVCSLFLRASWICLPLCVPPRRRYGVLQCSRHACCEAHKGLLHITEPGRR
jgi:hypothetical protein